GKRALVILVLTVPSFFLLNSSSKRRDRYSGYENNRHYLPFGVLSERAGPVYKFYDFLFGVSP
ncbi:MAG: hypothetical protein WBL73_07625, partial [bacterium]